MFRVGCDVGGTNTDAAILDVTRVGEASRGVLSTCKTPTTPDVTQGIKIAIQEVLTKSSVNPEKISNVAIGTTHFVNAVIENDAHHLSRVACIRLCGPYTRENPPFSDYPWALRGLIEGPTYYLDGGLEIDGREITPLNHEQICKTALEIRGAGISSVAVVGVFSALDHSGLHEETCKRLILEACPGLSVVCSHTIGGPGLLVRENATILNAAILSFARKTVAGFRRAVSELGLKCPLFLTQNDGTLIEASLAAELPVKTFASGPTNSLMGAAFLQNLSDISEMNEKQVLVVDVGGTTTDICALLPSGFPRKAPNYVQVGGVRTAFSMPDVFSIGLGGGSRVRIAENGHISIGPDSVAHRLTTAAMVFGGATMTTSDVVVATGIASIGEKSHVASIPKVTVDAAMQEIKRKLIQAIESMKVSNAPVVVLLVGGGSIIVDGDLEGVVQCLRPPHHDSANAVGAAIAKVAGDVDTIEVLEGQDEGAVLERVKIDAIEAAISKGADPNDVHIAEVTKLPLQYVTNKATRFLVKAVGSLKTVASRKVEQEQTFVTADAEQTNPTSRVQEDTRPLKPGSLATPTVGVDLDTYRPDIRDGVWYVTPVDVDLIAVGCGVLGTGGGGSSYNQALHIFSKMHQMPEKAITVRAHDSLNDSDICVFGAGFGAPSVSDERIDSGTSVFEAIDHLNRVLHISDFQGIVADEIGGGNGLITFPSSAHYDRPVIDCDLMGRAFPTVEHCTPYLYGQPMLPCSIADTKGNVGLVVAAESRRKIEDMLRTTCIELGNHVSVTLKPLTGDVIKKYAVPNTVSQAWFLGRAVRSAQRTKINFIKAIENVMPVKMIYTGKIVNVKRNVSKGYTMGECEIAPLSTNERESMDGESFESKNLILPFQNEYLAAYLVDQGAKQGDKEFICTVPDLISVLGQNGEAIGSPELRYGLQVSVIAMPAHPLWTTEEGLKVGGPEYFRLDTPWKSIGEYKKPLSVFDVYGNGELTN